MLPMLAIREAIGTDLATSAPLAQVTALNRVALVINPFTPEEGMALTDLTLATFDGHTALIVASGDQQVGLDPVTGDQIITIVEPLGGWRWITTGTTNLPQTIYGYALYDSTGPGPLLGVQLLPTPIGLTAVGQQINLGTVAFTVVQQPLF